MPKPNSGAGRRNSSRSGGRSDSGKRRPARDTSRKEGDDARPARRPSSRPRSGPPKSTSGKSPSDKRGASDKPFRKSGLRAGDKFSSDSSGKERPFSQRSRFAKPPAKAARTESAGPGRREKKGASFGKPYKRTYRTRPERPQTSTRKPPAQAEGAPKSDKVRLNKFIANSGISSRREADELIKMGLISVNGQVITELGYKVNRGDEVRYEDKVLRAERPVYILMNKPKGFLTTTDDPQERKTVMHIIGSAVKERIYPVGRLDRNTTGLLLLTNDGDLADKLMHPSFNVKKVYKVELDRALTKADFQTIIEGVKLEEGRAVVDDLAIVSEDGKTVGIELHIGWNRVVRRIFESLGYEVIKLDRTVYAGLDKKELGRGQWRFLSKEEIIHLKHFK